MGGKCKYQQKVGRNFSEVTRRGSACCASARGGRSVRPSSACFCERHHLPVQDPFVKTAAGLCQALDTVQQVAQSWCLAHMTLHHPDGETKRFMVKIIKVIVLLLSSRLFRFVTIWTAAHQASMSFTISQTMGKLPSIESVMPSSHLILCHPLLLFLQYFPPSRSFQMSRLPASGGQSSGASASVLPMNI